jgi:hypothetical protein
LRIIAVKVAIRDDKKNLYPHISADKIHHGYGADNIMDIRGQNNWIFQLYVFGSEISHNFNIP